MRFNVDRMFVSQNRRERISERLKILQELIPNGSKVSFFGSNSWQDYHTLQSWTTSTQPNSAEFYLLGLWLKFLCWILQVDLVTMLEKAISYVKFLQLQVKVGLENNTIIFIFCLIYSFLVLYISLCMFKSYVTSLVTSLFTTWWWSRCWQLMNFGLSNVEKLLTFLK